MFEMTINKMPPPMISVVMSVYNGEAHLSNSVESILNQSFRDFEFIIINDGSTDRTKEILESFKDPRIVLVEQENQGLIKSLNRGIQTARGKYIARQDADDISMPDRFRKQIEFLENNPGYCLVGSWAWIIDEEDEAIGELRHETGHFGIVRRLAISCPFVHSSTMYSRDLALEVGGYDEKMLHAEDYDMWLRLSSRCKAANMPEFLQKWRYNKSSGISVLRQAIQRKTSREIRKKYFHLLTGSSTLGIGSKALIVISFPAYYLKEGLYHDVTSAKPFRAVKKLAYLRSRASGKRPTVMDKIYLLFCLTLRHIRLWLTRSGR